MDPQDSKFPDRFAEAPFEEGYPLPEAEPSEVIPPGGGKYAVAPYLTFSQIVNYASRTWRWTHDEALKANRSNALAIRRDPVIMDALRDRQIPTVQLPWHLECPNDQDSRQAAAVNYLTDSLKQIPRWQQLLMHLQEGMWFGRYGVQLATEWDYSTGKKRLLIRDFKPVNGDKLVFKYSGQAGVLVHATYQGTWQVTDRGRCHFFTPQEREQMVIHRYEPEDADFYEPELAGGIQGVGIRGRIYWLWYLRQQVTSFLMDYLERVGAGGLTVYYYEAGNSTSLSEVKAAATTQWRNNAVLFPRYRDGTTGGPGVEVIAASQAGAALLQSLITEYYDATIRRYILGQSQPSDAAGAGLGSGIASYLEGNLGRRIKYDAVNLADTLTSDLVHVLQKYSPYKDLPGIKFVFDIDKPNAGELMQAAQAFYEMGGEIDEDQLRSVIGLEKPQSGHAVLAQAGAMSPAGVGAVPTGVPMLGTPGPEAGGGSPGQVPQAGMSPAGQPVQMRRTGARLRYWSKIKKALRLAKSGSKVQPPATPDDPLEEGLQDMESINPARAQKYREYAEGSPQFKAFLTHRFTEGPRLYPSDHGTIQTLMTHAPDNPALLDRLGPHFGHKEIDKEALEQLVSQLPLFLPVKDEKTFGHLVNKTTETPNIPLKLPKEKRAYPPQIGQYVFFRNPAGEVIHIGRVHKVKPDEGNWNLHITPLRRSEMDPEETTAYYGGFAGDPDPVKEKHRGLYLAGRFDYLHSRPEGHATGTPNMKTDDRFWGPGGLYRNRVHSRLVEINHRLGRGEASGSYLRYLPEVRQTWHEYLKQHPYASAEDFHRVIDEVMDRAA